jgi:hypothetical protein
LKEGFMRAILQTSLGRAARTGIFAIGAASAMLMSPVMGSRHNVQAAIEETVPDSIPAEVVADWKNQDGISDTGFDSIAAGIAGALPAKFAEKYNAQNASLSEEKRYILACHYRRVSRMKNEEADLENIMFARHHNFGGREIGYHDNSDAAYTDSEWTAQGALCVLTMKNYYSPFKEMYTRTDACVRDPCISFNGKKVVFAISGTGKGTGYKIYEMEIARPETVKQLTFDPDGLPGVADFEPCYLANGDIMFSSTRNFGIIDDGFQPTTNMFLMSGEGKFIRQVGFDQAHTFYPVAMDDGTILYTRWEYNDRDITSSMGLFVMNPDGAHQTEYFGNQTPWPLTMIQARPIPNTYGGKVMCIAGGQHGPYSGEVMTIDRNRGVNGTAFIQMVAPRRETKPDAKKDDIAMGGVNFLFQNPYPLDENTFLVSWRKSESERNYRLYFMDIDGNRELLAWADQSLSQPVVMKPREEKPPQVALQANYKDSVGLCTVQDVYVGEGMKGAARGSARSLRVVALHYRVAGCGDSTGRLIGPGPAGAYCPTITCPVSAYGASWEAKEVLGEAKIYSDGSAAFAVPARTPVYFQVIDSNGYCMATMRSWATLMPGEKFACMGCHENKIASPPPSPVGQAGSRSRPLETPLGIEKKRFDYKEMVQPIFDKKCAVCHTADHSSGFDLTGSPAPSGGKKTWTTSYTSLLKGIPVSNGNEAVNIGTIFSQAQQQPPYSFGSSLSGIMTKGGMSGNHHDVPVTETERRIIACWIDLCAPYDGYYNGSMPASDSAAYARFEAKRLQWEAVEKENIKALLAANAVLPDDRRSGKISRSMTEQPGIRYVPSLRALVVKTPSAGTLTVMDLRGRITCRNILSNRHTVANRAIALPESLGTGLFVARFKGHDGIRQTKFSVVE